MKISYLSGAAAVLAFALTQTSGAGNLILTDTTKGTPETWTISGNATVDGQGNITLTATPPTAQGPCTGAGTLSFSSTSYSVAEGSSTNITVNRTVCSQGAVTVSYATSNGSATAGTDYNTASGVLSWDNNETGPKSFPVSTIGETTPITESNKTVSLALSGVTGGATQGTAAATLTITDVAAAGGDPTCPAPPAGLAITEVAQSLGTKKTYTYGTNQGRAIRFIAGNNSFGSVGWIIPSGITPVSQLVSISRCPGDFTRTYPCGSTGTQNTLFTTGGAGASFTCPLTAGQVYYVNVRNGISTAASGVTVELK